ncbi:hypothetical protein [Streptomyces chrestomyceticus]
MALIEGPRIVARKGNGRGGSGGCPGTDANLPTFEFVLTAETP